MDFDKAGNAEDLDNKKLQLICNAYNRRLLSSQRVVDGINSMDYSKLKILCKYNNKFSYKGIEELLSDESIVNNIKDYDDEIFRSMLNDAPSEHNILEILKGGEVCNTNNEFESSDSEEDKDLSDSFDCEESDEEMAMSSKSQSDSEEDKVKEDILKLQEDPEIAKNLSFIDDQTLKVICKKFSSSDIKALLENQAVVVNITDYNNKELEHVFNICGSLAIQNIIKVLSITPGKLRLICNKFSGEDIMELLGNQKVVEYLNFIDYKKFELIHNSDKFNSSKHASSSHKIIRLLENQKIVKHINFIDYEKLQFILCHNKFLLSDIIRLLKNQEVVENIISFNIEKFRLIFYRDELNCIDIIELLENQEVVNNIITHEIEKLKYVLDICNFLIEDVTKLLSINHKNLRLIFEKFSSSDIKALLENQVVIVNITDYNNKELEHVFNICGSFAIQNTIKVLSITPKKLRLIRNKFSFIDVRTLLENQKAVKNIDSLTLWKLELICNNKKFSSSDIKTLLENQKIFYNISDYKTEELQLVFDSYELSPQNIIKVLENITPEKLRLICNKFSPSSIQTLLENQKIFYNISDYKTEELQLVFDSYELNPQNIIKVLENITPEKLRLICNKFSSSNIKTLLENQKIVKGIGSITSRELEFIYNKKFSLLDIIKVLENIAPEKSEPIFEKFSFQDIIEVLEDQNAVKGINSVNTKELKAITDNVTGKVFVSIFKNFTPSVK
ncbi:hypothetical protein [Wolbachia endosymbiont (group B) of Gerris lacustris]|uniref:hypothetical protein n=1 Tax=Wolbachia endosymbiont (group B) of Gerris lacustris TaxID=3066159 RepID=UPI0033403CE9